MNTGKTAKADNKAAIDAVSSNPVDDSFKLLGDVMTNIAHNIKGTIIAGYRIYY